MIAANKDLSARVENLEHGHRRTASIIDVLVDEIEHMKALPAPTKRKIGFDLSGVSCPQKHPHSRLASFAILSSRSAMNRLCCRWVSSVHSTNPNCPTSTGLSQRHSGIFAAVSPAPQRPVFFSGGFANGHSPVSAGIKYPRYCRFVF